MACAHGPCLAMDEGTDLGAPIQAEGSECRSSRTGSPKHISPLKNLISACTVISGAARVLALLGSTLALVLLALVTTTVIRRGGEDRYQGLASLYCACALLAPAALLLPGGGSDKTGRLITHLVMGALMAGLAGLIVAALRHRTNPVAYVAAGAVGAILFPGVVIALLSFVLAVGQGCFTD